MNQEPNEDRSIFALGSGRTGFGSPKPPPHSNRSRGNNVGLGMNTSRSAGVIDKDHSLSQEISEKNSMLGWKITITISGGIIILFLVSWILYWGYHEKLWRLSLHFAKSFKKRPKGLWKIYLTTFHWPGWTSWKYALAGILLVLSPSKVSALKSLWFFFLSNWFRAHFQTIVRESRPYFKNYLKAANYRKCDCSYGYPSQVAEEGVLIYLILIHEFVLHRSLAQKWSRISLSLLAVIILGNVLFCQVIFGQHSFLQLVNGTLHGAFFYCVMLLLTNPLTTIFRHFLEKKNYAQSLIIGSSITMYLITVLMWFSIYRWILSDDRVDHIRCGYCFYDSNKILKRRMAKLLTFSTYLIGITLGVFALQPIYMGKNESALWHHISWKGIARILIAAVVHLPLIFLHLAGKLTGDIQIFVRPTILIACGFMVAYLPVRLFALLSLSLRGDLYPKDFDMLKDEKTYLECSPLLSPDLPLHRRRMDAESHNVNVHGTVFRHYVNRSAHDDAIAAKDNDDK